MILVHAGFRDGYHGANASSKRDEYTDAYKQGQRARELMKHPSYKPLTEPLKSLVRTLFHSEAASKLPPIGNNNTPLFNKGGMQIATGYTRIVVGDYGAYIEMAPLHIVRDNIEAKFPGKPKRPVKYLWLQTKDVLQTKVYYQRDTVAYADYIPGMYYVSPEDLEL